MQYEEFKNDLGKPWRWQEGENTITRGCPWSAPGCHPVGCGLKITTDKDGKIIHVEGDENHPVSKGRLCPRCITLKDYVYNPSRILHPMKRDKAKRGDADAWEQCTWDEALDIIKENYDYVCEHWGSESVWVNLGTGREGGTMGAYGTVVFETPNFGGTLSGQACYIPRLFSNVLLCGAPYPELDYAGGLPGGYDNPEYDVPEVIMIWGKDPLQSSADGFYGHAIIDLIRLGSRLIVVDPRCTWLSTRADYHLRLRPGTDTALSMAMINVIIGEDLYDHDFVAGWTLGFEELAERVKEMPPSKAAEICGVAEEDIIGAARLYAAGNPSAINMGLAIDQNTNGLQNGAAINSMAALCGNLDVPGGQLFTGVNDESGMGDTNIKYDELIAQKKRPIIGAEEFPLQCMMMKSSCADSMINTKETGKPYPIKMVFHAGSNMYSCMAAEPQRWHAAMDDLHFGLGFDVFMTPTIQSSCDVVLPLSASVERDGTVMTHFGGVPVTWGFMRKTTQTGECVSDMELVWILGNKLHPENFEDIESQEDLINLLRFGRRHDFYELSEQVVVQLNSPYFKWRKGLLRGDGKPGFNTMSGRFEFTPGMYAQFGEDTLPYYKEPVYSPVSTPELAEEYPLVLTTGARSILFFHSENRQIPRLRELNPDPLIEINPKTAKAKGIINGQWVRVWNMFGEAYYKAKVSPIVDENTVMAQHGWWFPEQDGNEPNLYGTFRSNINNLIPTPIQTVEA